MGVNNLSKLIGYVPVLNMIIGIARIVLNIRNMPKNPIKRDIQIRHIYKGAIEIFASPLLIVVDLIQTIRDQLIVREYFNKHPEIRLQPLFREWSGPAAT